MKTQTYYYINNKTKEIKREIINLNAPLILTKSGISSEVLFKERITMLLRTPNYNTNYIFLNNSCLVTVHTPNQDNSNFKEASVEHDFNILIFHNNLDDSACTKLIYKHLNWSK